MWNYDNKHPWTHDLNAYIRLLEAQDPAVGQSANPDATPSGVSRHPEPSGVLGPLVADRQTARTAADIGLAPRSGRLPVWSGASMPSSSFSAQRYGDLCHGIQAHNTPVWRADDVPEPPGATGQRTSLEDAVVHGERQAPDDRPSTSRAWLGMRADTIRHEPRLPDADTPYPADMHLIERLVSGALIGGSNLSSVKKYSHLLTRFSAWLRHQHKAGLQDRLFQDDLKHDALRFQKEKKCTNLAAALAHLRTVESSAHGTVKIPGYHVVPDGDGRLINRAFPDGAFSSARKYACDLRVFSVWLHQNGKKALCEAGALHSETLMDDFLEFMRAYPTRGKKVRAALRQLRIFDRTGAIAVSMRSSLSEIPAVDRQLVDKFKNALLESRGWKTHANGETNAGRLSARMGHFCVWLQQQGKEPVALRLHDPVLDIDLNFWTRDQTYTYAKSMRNMLKQVREIFPPKVPSPCGGSRAEPSESSYSPMFPPTPVGGWSQAPESSWYPDTPAVSSYSALFPPTSSGGWPQTSQSHWNPDTPAEYVTGPSRSPQPESSGSTLGDLEELGSGQRYGRREFDWDAMQEEVTGPRHTVAVPRASIPTFGQDDTGPHWEHRPQPAPEWLVNRGVYDQQIVRINDLECRVVAMPGVVSAWGQPQLFLYPHLRGG